MKKIIVLLISMLAGMTGLKAQSMNAKDAEFTKQASQSGLLEIRLGELSITHAYSDSVRVFGRQMVLDHTKSNDQLKTFAVSHSFVLSDSLNPEYKARYDSLSRKTGPDFDRAYVRFAVWNHKQCIAMFKEENHSGYDKDLKTWASVTLPVLENHLITAQDLSVDIDRK